MATRRKGGGRKPKPTALKILHGTARKDRINPAEPKPEIKIIQPPEYLSPLARECWMAYEQNLREAGVMTVFDKNMLAQYCQAYATWISTDKILQEKGFLIKEGSGDKKRIGLNPYWKVCKTAFEQMIRIGCEFGLSPSSRTRISMVRKEDDDEFEAFLNHGKKKTK